MMDCQKDHGAGHPDCPKCWRWSERNPNAVPRPVEITVLDAEEWQKVVKAALENIGLTYDELEAQAQRRDFDSIEAMKLWYAIGRSVRQ